jgi:hypothetical protein
LLLGEGRRAEDDREIENFPGIPHASRSEVAQTPNKVNTKISHLKPSLHTRSGTLVFT